MSAPAHESDAYARYLRLLAVRARPPGLEALRELVAAHLVRVPFENVSKLYFRAEPAMRLPPLDRYLDGLEHQHFGGTCYANNFHLTRLLAHLGYDVRLCGADMSAPNVHAVGIVRLEGREYLVDGGYGAPFLEPLPLGQARDVVVELGRDRYVLRPADAEGRARIDLHRDGALRHGYRINPEPRRIEEFADVIERSFSERSTFMHALLVVRCFPGRSVVLNNLELSESRGRSVASRLLPGPEALPAALEEHFDIPRAVAARALDGVALTKNALG